jgi:hypothetical protein
MTSLQKHLLKYVPAVNVSAAKETLAQLHPGNQSALLPVAKFKSVFQAFFMSKLDARRSELEEADGATQIAADGQQQQSATEPSNPFEGEGRLAWVVQDPPDVASIVPNMLTSQQSEIVSVPIPAAETGEADGNHGNDGGDNQAAPTAQSNPAGGNSEGEPMQHETEEGPGMADAATDDDNFCTPEDRLNPVDQFQHRRDIG